MMVKDEVVYGTKDEARRCVRPPVLGLLGASTEITKHKMGPKEPLNYETTGRPPMSLGLELLNRHNHRHM